MWHWPAYQESDACIINKDGAVTMYKNIYNYPDIFMVVIQPFSQDLVVRVESIFTW